VRIKGHFSRFFVRRRVVGEGAAPPLTLTVVYVQSLVQKLVVESMGLLALTASILRPMPKAILLSLFGGV